MNTYIPIVLHPKQGSPPNPKHGYRLKQGFTLLELLISVSMIGILSAVMIPSLLQSRRATHDKVALAYAHNVYKVVQAYVSDSMESVGTIPTDCNTFLGYVAGSYSIQKQAFITTCSLNSEGSRVTVTYSGGTQTSLSIGQ